jgi:hypothetical protein
MIKLVLVSGRATHVRAQSAQDSILTADHKHERQLRKAEKVIN